MIKDRNIFFIGLFVLATQYLFGLPTFWKTILITFSMLLIMSFSVKITLPKKQTKNRTRKERVTPVFVESAPVYPKENTVEYLKDSDSNRLP